MKLNKIMFAVMGCLMLVSTAKAEYLGINDLAMKDSDNPLAFINAVKSLQTGLVKQWLDEGYSLKYDHTKWCAFAGESSYDYENPKNDEEAKKMPSMMIIMHPLIAVPSQCNKVPLWTLLRGLDNKYSPDILVYKPEAKKLSDFQRQEKVIEMINVIMAKMDKTEYEAYFPMAWNSRTPISLRKESLKRFIEGYKERDNLLTEDQKKYKENIQELEKNYDIKGRFSFLYSSINPGYVLLDKLVEEYLDVSEDYSSLNKSKGGILPKYTMSEIKQGGADLSKVDMTQLQTYQVYNLVQMNGILDMIKTILDSGITDVNFQNKDGESILHLMFSDRNFRHMKRNDQAASFVRYFLENGANPLLENKEGKTPYLMFEEKKRDAAEYESMIKINDAFQLKDFKDE